MENEEVEKALSNISEEIFDEEDIHCISEYIKQLEFENTELHWCINHNEKTHLFFTNNQAKIIEQLEESLKCAEYNFQTCNSDLKALGELVGGSCYDHTHQLVEKLKKAFDKACKELETLEMTFNNANYNDVKNSFEWKEWCINDE